MTCTPFILEAFPFSLAEIDLFYYVLISLRWPTSGVTVLSLSHNKCQIMLTHDILCWLHQILWCLCGTRSSECWSWCHCVNLQIGSWETSESLSEGGDSNYLGWILNSKWNPTLTDFRTTEHESLRNSIRNSWTQMNRIEQKEVYGQLIKDNPKRSWLRVGSDLSSKHDVH